MAKLLKSVLAGLTRISACNSGSFPLTRVRRVISGEQALGAGHGTREMPIWGRIFSRSVRMWISDAFASTIWHDILTAYRASSAIGSAFGLVAVNWQQIKLSVRRV